MWVQFARQEQTFCKRCTNGQPCGNSCSGPSSKCKQPPGGRMLGARDPMRLSWRVFGLMVGFALAFQSATAKAELILTKNDVFAALSSIRVLPLNDPPGALAIDTIRSPSLTLTDGGFELAMYWNGLDDQTWPFTRILDVLLERGCGSARDGWSEALERRLYASPSLVPEQQLGGNGGSTFKKATAGTVGNCRVGLIAQGARWHTITATVNRNSQSVAQSSTLIGPSYDCGTKAVATQPLAQLICANRELAYWELSYVIAYQALKEAANSNERKEMAAEANSVTSLRPEQSGVLPMSEK